MNFQEIFAIYGFCCILYLILRVLLILSRSLEERESLPWLPPVLSVVSVLLGLCCIPAIATLGLLEYMQYSIYYKKRDSDMRKLSILHDMETMPYEKRKFWADHTFDYNLKNSDLDWDTFKRNALKDIDYPGAQ